MSISLEKIDLLKERANVGYKEAKEALEQCDGDLVEALIWLEDNEKIKSDRERQGSKDYSKRTHRERNPENDFGRKVEDSVKSVHKMRFKIFKDDDVLLNLPATVAIIVGVFTLPMSIFALLAAVIFRYHIAIIKPDGKEIVVDENIKETVKDEIKPENQDVTVEAKPDEAVTEEESKPNLSKG